MAPILWNENVRLLNPLEGIRSKGVNDGYSVNASGTSVLRTLGPRIRTT